MTSVNSFYEEDESGVLLFPSTNLARACALIYVALEIPVWLVCEERMHLFVSYVAIGFFFMATGL